MPLTVVDAKAVTLTIVTAPSHGTLTGLGPRWTYTPAPNYAGSDTAVVAADFARVVKVRPGEQHPHLQRWRSAMAQRPSMSL